jgi:hypothetical protein
MSLYMDRNQPELAVNIKSAGNRLSLECSFTIFCVSHPAVV